MSKYPPLDISLNNYSVPSNSPRFRKSNYNSSSRFLTKTITATSAAAEPEPDPFTNTASVLFDGIDERMLIANSSTLFVDGETAAGWSFWINPPVSGTSGEFFLNKTFSAAIVTFRGEIQASGTHIRWFMGSTSNFRKLSRPLPTGSWTHIFINYDGTQASANNRVRMWMNGELDITGTNGGTMPAAMVATTGTNTTFGGISSDANSYNCYLDEFSIWNISSSQAQIDAIYNGGVPTNLSGSTGLIHWWRMGDGANFPVIPNEMGGPSGTLVNMESSDITSSVPGA